MKNPFNEEISIFAMIGAAADFYGPGGPYECFAGRHASHGLAKMSTDETDVEGDLSALSASEIDILQNWYSKFESKYPIIGTLKVD